MSISNQGGILVIGDVPKGMKIMVAPLLEEAGDAARDPLVEWLFFYRDNMGIITEPFGDRLITGYPILDFTGKEHPFTDRVSRELLEAFFPRFLFSRKPAMVIAATPVARDALRAMTLKAGHRFFKYRADETPPRLTECTAGGERIDRETVDIAGTIQRFLDELRNS